MSTLWLFLVVLGAIDLAVSDLSVRVSPNDVYPCGGSQISLNCTFDLSNVTDLYKLVSISLYKTQGGSLSQNLASIDAFTNSIHMMPHLSDKASLSGALNSSGAAYLILQFPTAAEDEIGTYECEANGINEFGHPEFIRTDATFVDELPDLTPQPVMTADINIEDMLSELEAIMEKDKDKPEGYFSNYDNYFVSSNYSGHHYLVPKEDLSYDQMWLQCNLRGGYFAEINTKGEFDFIVDWMNVTVYPKLTTQHKLFVTGAVDSGSEYFFLRHPGDPMYLSWGWTGTYPRDIYYCLSLVQNVDFQFVGTMCDAYDVSYICEIDQDESVSSNL